jgi:adenylate cyclase
MKEHRKLAAVMFTDIAGYTSLMSKDEQKALALLQKNRDLQKSLAKKHHGEFLKEMGDGALLCFQSALDAVRCAMEIQKTVQDDSDLNLRIGIHLGDIVFKDGDVFGDGVNVASRIEKLAEAGGIYISGQIYKTVQNKPGIDALPVGEKRLKHVEEPVMLYALCGPRLPKPSIRPTSLKHTMESGKKQRKKILIPAGILVFFAIVVSLIILFVPDLIKTRDTRWQNSIAVLPFADMSLEKNQDYFCDGMAEEIINALVNIENLQVIARTSSFAFKGENLDVRDIGKKLGVATLLEGSVRKEGNKLRVSAKLVKTKDGSHLWSGLKC